MERTKSIRESVRSQSWLLWFFELILALTRPVILKRGLGALVEQLTRYAPIEWQQPRNQVLARGSANTVPWVARLSFGIVNKCRSTSAREPALQDDLACEARSARRTREHDCDRNTFGDGFRTLHFFPVLAFLLSRARQASRSSRSDDTSRSPIQPSRGTRQARFDQAGVITDQADVASLAGNHAGAHDLRVYGPWKSFIPNRAPLHHRRRHERRASDEDHKQAFGLAQVCGARVAVLPQCPTSRCSMAKTEDELSPKRSFVTYRPKTRTDRCSSQWPRVPSRPWMHFRRGERRRQAGDEVCREGGSEARPDDVAERGPLTTESSRLLDGDRDAQPRSARSDKLKVWGQYSEQIHDYVERD